MSEPLITISKIGEKSYCLHNGTSASFAEQFFLAWFLEHDGIVIDKGEIAKADAPAGGEYTFNFEHDLPETGIATLLLSVVTGCDSELSPRDREVACAQFVLSDVREKLTEACEFPLRAEETDSVFAVHSVAFAHAFAKDTLLPLQLVAEERSLLAAPVTAVCGAHPIRIFKPTLRYSRTEAKLSALFAALDGEKPVAAGEMYTYIYGNGDVVLDFRPDREGDDVVLTIPLRPEFDYIEYFACSEVSTVFGGTQDVLALSEGPAAADSALHRAARRIALSSGEVTLHIRPEEPTDFRMDSGKLTMRLSGHARVKLSLENELI